jgi:hypothetical protein
MYIHTSYVHAQTSFECVHTYHTHTSRTYLCHAQVTNLDYIVSHQHDVPGLNIAMQNLVRRMAQIIRGS